MEEGDVEAEQLQPAPAFSAQLLQQSITAMKTLPQQPPKRAAGPARKAVITVGVKWDYWLFFDFWHTYTFRGGIS